MSSYSTVFSTNIFSAPAVNEKIAPAPIVCMDLSSIMHQHTLSHPLFVLFVTTIMTHAEHILLFT